MKDLEFLKNFKTFFVNEAEKPKPGPKVGWYEGSAKMSEIKALSQESYDYILEVTKILKTEPIYKDVEMFKMLFNKKAQLGLTAEQAQKLIDDFGNDQEIKVGEDQFNTIFIDKKSFKEILEENVKLKAMYTEMENAIKTWNTSYASIFNFDNNVSDKVSNADETNKALTALKDILVKYNAIVKNASVDLTGYTSTIPVKGDPEGNKKLSNGRAATIKNMLLAIYPEAKDLSINAIGKGEESPLFPDDKDDAEKQKKNRRVEAKVVVTSQPEVPTEVEKFNVVIYGFVLTELTLEKKVPQKYHAPKKQKGFKPLNKKKAIPCPRIR